MSSEPPITSGGVPASDLSSWDSTEEEDEIPPPSSNQQFGLRMKHSEGMMDLSKVLLEEERNAEEKIAKQQPALRKMKDMDEERIYDSVENLRSENQISVYKGLENKNNTYAAQVSMQIKTNGESDNSKNIFPSNLHTEEEAFESNIDPYSKSHQYEKILHPPQHPLEENHTSDWDSPLLSDDKEIPISKRVSPFMSTKTGESTSPSERKQNSLIDPVSKAHIPKQQPNAQYVKLSSPSLKKFKEYPEDDENSIIRADPYSSLPIGGTETQQDLNVQTANQIR